MLLQLCADVFHRRSSASAENVSASPAEHSNLVNLRGGAD
jgi:hypothetical protein